MDAAEVLATARSGAAPESWTVWPLRRERVLRSAANWGMAAVLAFALFIPAVVATVPDNFTDGTTKFFLTGLLLLVLGVAAFGALGICVFDFWRLLHAEEFMIVMTPDDFVKVERDKVIHVPMESVGYVTLRGVRVPNEEYQQPDAYGSIDRMRLARLGLGVQRQPARPPSLAFVDMRDDREVVVATDNTYDELPALDYVLQDYAERKQRSRTG